MAVLITIFLLFSLHFSFTLQSCENVQIRSQNSLEMDSKLEWDQEFLLDKDFYLRVSVDRSHPDWMTMEMSAPVQGFVAIGFSPTGLMPESDVVIGWLDGATKEAHLIDMYTVGYVRPVKDDEQNYELIGVVENEVNTTVRFRRPFVTSDKFDRNIEHDSKLNVIWTWHPNDPVECLIVPTYHFGNTPIQLNLPRLKGKPRASLNEL